MNGKGDRPRNNYTNKFRNNYDAIDWSKSTIKNTDTSEKIDCKDCKDRVQPPRMTYSSKSF